MVFAAVAVNKKPFYIICKEPPKPKKGEKPEKGLNARRYQQEERVQHTVQNLIFCHSYHPQNPLKDTTAISGIFAPK